MPLLPNVLQAELLNLDSDGGAKDVAAAAGKWFNAWWTYAQNMTYLVPGGGGRPLVESSFKGILLAGLSPSTDATLFFTMLGTAMTAAWATLGTPASLTPPILSLIPAPAPFGPMAAPVVPVGLAASNKAIPRTLLATLIHTWTITIQAVGPSGPVGPIS